MENSTETAKHYSNGEITVVWKPSLCIHSEKCWRGLPQVFNPKERPWINAKGATTEAIKNQVSQCPSGALSFLVDAEQQPTQEATPKAEIIEIEMAANGPLLIKGDFSLKNTAGEVKEYSGRNALCRCGASANKPFCDGSHKKIDFQG